MVRESLAGLILYNSLRIIRKRQMKLSLVFPMFWGREKAQIYLDGDQFYDHPTALDDHGTIPPLFESMRLLADREFDVIAIAGANHPSIAAQVEAAATELLHQHAQQAGVQLHFFSYSHLSRLREYLEEIGKTELSGIVELVGYSPMRNACLIAAHILGKDIAVSIDDDCVFIEPGYIGRIKEKMLSEFNGLPIHAYCGPYLTESDSIYLPRPTSASAAYWNVIDVMNETFRQYIVEAPGMKEVPFAIMGNIAVHRSLFTRVPLDPPMRRGEDMDWVMNSHILGECFVLDTELIIKHLPPPRPYPAWRPMREDIYRFRYQRAKVDKSWEGDGHYKLNRDDYLPYPGSFFEDDFIERASNASTMLALEYLANGQNDDAAEAINNIYHAHYLAEPEGDPYAGYLAFQSKWEELMGIIDERRSEIVERVFS
jgi:hypothetical protein